MAPSAKSVVPVAGPEHAGQAPRFLPLETIAVRLLSPPHTDRRPVFGIISNMSETGTCIITNLSLPVGATVAMAIENRRHKNALEVSARVVWCAERFEPVKEIVGYLTGLSFDPDGVESVRRLLANGLFQSIP
jgi:hypothetical protein